MSPAHTPSPKAEPTDITLAGEIRALDSALHYPATDLIKELLKFHRTDTDHERNIYLSAQVFQRARIAYEAINGLIKQVDEQQELDYDKWVTYTNAIPPLEEILLRYWFDKPGKKRKHVPSEEEDVPQGLVFIDTWVQDRKMLNSVLESLANETLGALSNDARVALFDKFDQQRKRDDDTTMIALYEYIGTFGQHKLKDQDIFDKKRNETPVSDIRTGLRGVGSKWKSKPPNELTSEAVILTFMIASIPFTLLDRSRPSNDKALPPGVKEHLASMKIWKAMKELVLVLIDVLDKMPGPEQEPVYQKWLKQYKDLRSVLVEVSPVHISLGDDILELIKLSAKIRAPFHERTIGLLKIIRDLDIASSGSPLQARRILQDTVKEINKQLKDLADDMEEDVKKVILESVEYTSRAGEMNKLFSGIQQTSGKLNVGADWSKLQKAYNDGVSTDEKHLRKMRGLLSQLEMTT